MRCWWLVPCVTLAVACQPTGRLDRTASPVKWEVLRGDGFAVTDGRHRFRLPDAPDFLPREEPWRIVSTPDTDGDGRPEAVVEGFTGGAHCCFVYLVFESRPGAVHQLDRFDLGNGRLERAEDLDRDGRSELLAGDDRLAYFDDLPFAYSPMLPLVLCRSREGRFEDCTERFPRLLSSELERATRSLEDKVRRLRTQAADREVTELVARSEALTVFVLTDRLGKPEDGRARVRRLCPACLHWLDRHSEELSQVLRSPRPRPWSGN
ncbi:MAG: hypothetical protein QN202_08440 [Armatimonadota bacterium]|nr:hypothetical protein [Armatimonadota bacterium]